MLFGTSHDPSFPSRQLLRKTETERIDPITRLLEPTKWLAITRVREMMMMGWMLLHCYRDVGEPPPGQGKCDHAFVRSIKADKVANFSRPSYRLHSWSSLAHVSGKRQTSIKLDKSS